MEWWLLLLVIFGCFILLMLTGFPIAFAFLAINIVGAFFLWGGQSGFRQLILSIFESVTFFALLPVPLFILMGEVLFHSGMGTRMLDALDAFLGKMPGRLSLVAVAGGVLVAVLCGNTWASTAMLGSMLAPEMRRRGYHKAMALGPIMGGGALAIIIPPSGMSVVLATLAGISVGGLLIAGLVPGLVMAGLFVVYIVGRCIVQPGVAPAYRIRQLTLIERFTPLVKYVLPLGIIVFSVIGLMLLGLATPSESAAFGVMATFVCATLYRGLTWDVMRKSFTGTMRTTTMILMIFCGSTAFSQVLSFSGATKGVVNLAVHLPIPPIALLISMMMVVMFLGMFMDQLSILMITLPIFMPVCQALNWDPLWFGLMLLINMSIANLSPPFGIELFVMKGVSPPDISMGDVYRASVPFILMEVMVIALVIIAPPLATWLPGVM
ncbi:MAG: TRAP transporter large permease subunit [Deltaproteobacteria bacterium]|nr:TRAP transporter large permease subunit [Deltaproteobacteria bacterium]